MGATKLSNLVEIESGGERAMASHAADMLGGSKRCVVVMGFGVKTDYATGRTHNLDKSHRLLLEPVVAEKGLVCV